MADLKIPSDFKLGVSTASYQIEGAIHADGKGESVWDRFTHTPGKIERGENADVATDHYHRWEEDLDLISRANLDVYRFSVAWPRVQPTGTGPANAAGLDFYDRLVDGCLARGIEPWVCLFHWDLPQALEDRGGWPNPDTARWYADYAGLVARRLGDRAARWVTFNEPSNPALRGYGNGLHAPGRTDWDDAVRAVHTFNRAHVLGADRLRDEIGTVLALNAYLPFDEDEAADREAAQRTDDLHHGSFTQPVVAGTYPERLLDRYEALSADADLIARAPDTLTWLGVNYYGPFYVSATGGEWSARPGKPTTALGWEIDPRGMTDWLVRLHESGFDKPLFVTENGFPLEGERVVDGRVDDRARIDFLRAHIQATLDAREKGVDVRGYLAWTLVDNFEWAFGWRTRFGLVHLDRETCDRTPKDSYHWLAEVAGAR